MRLSFDIKCEDHITQPAYRVLVNGELIAERDFVIPSALFSHYAFSCDLDLPAGENKFTVEAVNTDVSFTQGQAWLGEAKINHKGGVFYNENT